MSPTLCALCGERPAKYRSPSRSGKLAKDKDHDLCIACAASKLDVAHAQVMALRAAEADGARNEGAILAIVSLLRAGAFFPDVEEFLWDWVSSQLTTVLYVRGERIFPTQAPNPSGGLSTPEESI